MYKTLIYGAANVSLIEMSTEPKDKDAKGVKPTDNPNDKGKDAQPNKKTIEVIHKWVVEGAKKPVEDPKKPDDKKNVEGDKPPEKPPKDTPKKEGNPVEDPKKDVKKNPDKDNAALRKELEETKTKLQERTAQVGTIVLEQFETDKAALLALVTDEKKKKAVDAYIGTSPDKLEDVKMWTRLFIDSFKAGGGTVEGAPADNPGDAGGDDTGGDDGGSDDNPEDIKNPPPKGKAGLPKVDKKFASGQRIFDDLYDVLQNEHAAPTEIEAANQKINELMLEMMKGRSAAEKAGKAKFTRIEFKPCPECGTMIQGAQGQTDACKACGWKLVQKKQSTAR